MRDGPSHDLVFGLHPVEETLAADSDRILEVLVESCAGPAARALGDRAKAAGLSVRVLPSQAFRDLSRGRPFQGIAAKLRAFEYADPDEVIEAAAADPRASSKTERCSSSRADEGRPRNVLSSPSLAMSGAASGETPRARRSDAGSQRSCMTWRAPTSPR